MSAAPLEPFEQTVGVVIIGAGHAGVECAFALRSAGYVLPITLMSDEEHEPYQRPPLSKSFLSGEMQAHRLALRSPQAYEKQNIKIRVGDPVVRIEPASNTVVTVSGQHIPYAQCVLATGAQARRLAQPQGTGIYSLRSLEDALTLKSMLSRQCRLLIVGGGYLGLEVAATAVKLGATVSVLEQSAALMSGKVSAHTSCEFQQLHDQAGIRLIREAAISQWESLESGGWKVHLANGSTHEGDVVFISIGAVPNTQLALDAGISCDDGILVDDDFRTSVPTIFAIGDCARGYRTELHRHTRIESVQNALDSARTAAAAIIGQSPAAKRPATFWSEQHGRRLQMAGLINPAEPVHDHVTRTANGWLVERYQRNVLTAIEALDSPVDFVKALKRIGAPKPATESNTSTQTTETHHAHRSF